MSSTSPTDTAAARPDRWRVVLTRCAFFAAALLTLAVGFYVVESLRGKAAWTAYQDEARARGVKLALAEYIPPPIPDERNFAAIPLFQDAFKSPSPPYPMTWLSEGTTRLPPLGSGFKTEAIDFQAWQKFFVDKKMLAVAGDNPAADVLAALDRYAPLLEQLRLAGQRPDCRFPVDYHDPINAALPHLAYLRDAARIYVLRLAAHLALGDSPAAYEDFRGGFRLFTALEKEPTLIAGLVRLSILGMEENGIAAGLIRHQWGDTELKKIIADLNGVRLMDDYAFSLGSERGCTNMIHELFLGRSAREMADLVFGARGFEPQLGKRLGPALVYLLPNLYPRGWIRLSQTRANEYFDQMLARVAQDPPRIFTERPGPSLLQPIAQANALDRMRYVLFLSLAPYLSEMERTYGYGETTLDQTRLGCALERHRLADGSFPASLEPLVPAYLPALPPDVMNGEPLHYRLEPGGGYTLYSVGWNLQDDGGKLVVKGSGKQQPDWVWSIPR